ncbi:MAG: hypothetical protein M0002_07175 [Rhodospirillales bacterium]|nr:hypothetical protein [Rhodospirillales bacterium]
MSVVAGRTEPRRQRAHLRIIPDEPLPWPASAAAKYDAGVPRSAGQQAPERRGKRVTGLIVAAMLSCLGACTAAAPAVVPAAASAAAQPPGTVAVHIGGEITSAVGTAHR